jgi:hypothetical protein
MAFTPFKHARLKLARGRKHIADLEQGIAYFLSQKPHVAIIAEQSLGLLGTRYHMHTYCVVEMQDELPLIFGDAVHNLRVALDVLANDAVALSGTPPKDVYFPFGKDPEHLEDMIKKKMKGAAPDAKALVRSLKPYDGGNDALRALHDLDIKDKHIAPLETENSITTPPAEVLGTKLDYSKAGLVPLDQSLLPSPYTSPDGAKVLGMSRDFNCEVVIAKGLPLAGQPVVGALGELSVLVEGVVETFEARFLGGS